MLIGSFLENGIEINLAGNAVSESYISLTAHLINRSGGSASVDGSKISVGQSTIDNLQSSIEADWSAASYFYAMAALRPNSEVLLSGLSLQSPQGDKRIASIMTEFGVTSSQTEKGVLIHSSSTHQSAKFSYDLSSQPDIVQTLACFHAARGDEVIFSGIDHLKFKETDRLLALSTQLKKFSVEFKKSENGWTQSGKAIWNGQAISTYGDHRMAMAFSILALEKSGLIIEDPDVVSKSYPAFWESLKAL